MGVIHILDSEVCNMIAAGEVVERPASVIKELIENSIDAGADKICIEIKRGGISYMRVTDNGSGILPDDIGYAFLRHATSKIEKPGDLDAIYTLGFRGEALCSVAAVSNVVLTTKTKSEANAVRAYVSGGVMENVESAGAPDGTSIEVKNLFYNTPARMKFLKKDVTEGNYITEIVSKFILSNPSVSFRLISNGKQVLFSSGDGNAVNAVYAVYGRDYASNLIPVEYESEGICVSGFVGKSSIARPNRTYQSFFVNGRYIKSRSVSLALEEAYKNQLMGGKFPFAVLNIKINADLIDVNVHPHKTEVKFSNEKKVFDAVYFGVKNAIYRKPDIPSVSLEARKTAYKFADKDEDGEKSALRQTVIDEKSIQKQDTGEEKKADTKTQEAKAEKIISDIPKEASVGFKKPLTFKEDVVNPYKKTEPPKAKKIDLEQIEDEEEKEEKISDTATAEPDITEKTDAPEPEIKQKNETDYRIVGQIFDTYIIIEREGEMLLVDQHAAHERLNYEKLKKDIEESGIESQLLIGGVMMHVNPTEAEAAESGKEELIKLGFDFDFMADDMICINSVPSQIGETQAEELFSELLEQIRSNKKYVISERRQRAIYTIACKAAIKANHALNRDEMKTLLDNVFALDNINTCPHGRPITVSVTKYRIEKMFKRVL